MSFISRNLSDLQHQGKCGSCDFYMHGQCVITAINHKPEHICSVERKFKKPELPVRPEPEIKITYVCDREACTVCSNPDCTHTTNIKHAVNFTEVKPGLFVEKCEEEE